MRSSQYDKSKQRSLTTPQFGRGVVNDRTPERNTNSLDRLCWDENKRSGIYRKELLDRSLLKQRLSQLKQVQLREIKTWRRYKNLRLVR